LNLHSIVAPIIGAVNPNHPVTLYKSTGFVTNSDFSRSPGYSTVPMSAQIQGLQSDDIRILNGLGIQGVRRKAYLWGTWTGLVRGLQKGNDLVVFPDSSTWKIGYVFEDFGHGVNGSSGWCSVALVLQNPISEDSVVIAGPVLPPADFSLFVPGMPGPSERLDVGFTRACIFPAGFPGAFATARVAAEALVTIGIWQITNGVSTSRGTLMIGAGNVDGTFSVPADVSVIAGDILSFMFPATPDSAMTDLTIAVQGYRV
jgi:hypothetical protein